MLVEDSVLKANGFPVLGCFARPGIGYQQDGANFAVNLGTDEPDAWLDRLLESVHWMKALDVAWGGC